MDSRTKTLRRAFTDKTSKRPAFWFLRQAGRYLPEYKEVRSNVPNFLDLCYNPALATQVTLQPITRFGMDAAIIFSDILVIPNALGVNVTFEENIGPQLSPVETLQDLAKLNWDEKKIQPVYDAIRETKKALPKETTLIGFAGSPWTLACYMVQGNSDKKFAKVLSLAATDPIFFSKLIQLLSACIIKHCVMQIQAGAEVIQLFDSWAGLLNENESEFTQWVIHPTKKIVQALKKYYPDIPIIGFPRNAGNLYAAYAIETKVDAINVDSSIPLRRIKNELQEICLVQGNLDPELLAGDKDEMLKQAKYIISMLANKPFIFNLGHGILPHTPVENVQALCDLLKNYDASENRKSA